MVYTCNKRKLIWAIILNLFILILEIVGVILSVQKHGIKVFEYYTENSNYFALIVSLLFVLAGFKILRKGEQIPIWVVALRFVSTVGLTITLVVVLTILVPRQEVTFIEMMFKNSCLYQHLLCPLLSLVSFLFLENQEKLPKSFVLFALLPTGLYGLILIFLNLIKVIQGPYPFFYFYVIPWQVVVFSLVAIMGGAVLISFILYLTYNRHKVRSF